MKTTLGHRLASRALRGRFTLAIAAVGTLVSTQSAAESADPSTRAKSRQTVPAQVVSSTASSLVFRVDLDRWAVTPSQALDGTDRVSIPGFISRGGAGEPSRPARKYLVGLPAEGTWTLSWRVLDTASLGSRRLEPAPFLEARREGDIGVVPVERYEIDPEVYGAFRSPPVVSADEPAWIRRQRVLPVWVEPLAYDPASGGASLATSIEITISFSAGPDENGARRGVPHESAEWQDMFSRLLVNAGQAGNWQLAPRERLRSQIPQRLESILQTDALIKLEVKETGIHKVSAGALVAAGFPSGQPIENLRLFKRGYDGDAFEGTATDIPFKVSEDPGGTPGVFDGQDVIIFYGLRPRDDASLEDPFEVFTGHSVYWLGATSGTTMTDRVLTPGFLTADTLNAWFPLEREFVDDRFFREETPVGKDDYYYHNGYEEFTVDFPFEMEAVRPGSFVFLTANLHGGFRGYRRSITTKLVNSQTDIVINPSLDVNYTDEINHQVNLSGDLFVVGDNTFHFERENAPDLPVHVFLNWLRVSYEALYRARGNSLQFNTGTLSGDTSVTVTGLSTTDGLWLFDVTDPLTPVNCVLDGGLFTDVGGSHALTFRDAISERKDYVLVPQSGMIEIQNDKIVLDTPSSIIGDPAETGVDVLVISHRDFVAGMQDWVRYRRAQGYRVLMVDVEDVYDEFNGGVPGRRGIDRFIRHFFELGNAGYVVLVGDGSEDHKQVHDDSAPDFVPSPARTEYVGGAFDEYEVVTLDKYYVKLPGPGGTVDSYPDLVIGRIPVGSTSELQRVLNKVYRYEQPSASESWRRRMIIFADDAWSGGFETVYRPAEKRFESYQDSTARIIERTHPGMFDVTRFYLSEYTRRITTDTTRSYTMYYVQEAVRRQATPVLMNEFQQGATLVTVQAHMNRSLITHEWLLTTMAGAVPTPNKDHQRMDNRDKPYIIFGMGCHFSDYALHRELAQYTDNSPNGDSFAEQLLFQNREGAVGTYGSTGFEYLNQVNEYCLLVANVWFYDAPYDTMINQTTGRWIFGPLMFLVEAVAIGDGQSRPVDRYHILGDPLLRIEAGAPLMEVTVNGQPVQSEDTVPAGVDTIRVVANVADENVIEKFGLLIDNQDMSHTLDVTPIGDESIPFSRRYEVRFEHAVQLHPYEIILRALQAPDTVAGKYHIEAQFVLNVASNIEVSVNGRLIYNGDTVPRKGDYRVRLAFPVYIPSSEISLAIDGEDVTGLTFTHPSPEDTTTWFIEFSKELDDGRHELVVTAGGTELSLFALFVSSAVGLRDVINYPNPFSDVTQFMYSNDVEIDEGTIDVFTVSGKRIVQLEIPPGSRMPGQNGVLWDGRDAVGDEIANGVYLYVIRVQQRGQNSTIRGKLARMK